MEAEKRKRYMTDEQYQKCLEEFEVEWKLLFVNLIVEREPDWTDEEIETHKDDVRELYLDHQRKHFASFNN